jgi:mannose-6-phosphate isomerase-like protein (cupin superfamily)
MSEPTVIGPGGGEVVGDSPERRVEILSDADALNATWSRFAPGREGADLHVHRRHSDLFYVLDGVLSIRLGVEDEIVDVPAGSLVRVPPMVVHGFRNGSDADVRYLNLHAPGREFAAYMRALRDGRSFTYDQEPPPADGIRPPADAAIAIDGVLVEAPGLRIEVLADVEEIEIASVRRQSGTGEEPHVHDHLESFFVLEGELALRVGDRELWAATGSWAQVPAGVEHAVACREPVHYLDVHTPRSRFGAFGQRRERSQ